MPTVATSHKLSRCPEENDSEAKDALLVESKAPPVLDGSRQSVAIISPSHTATRISLTIAGTEAAARRATPATSMAAPSPGSRAPPWTRRAIRSRNRAYAGRWRS